MIPTNIKLKLKTMYHKLPKFITDKNNCNFKLKKYYYLLLFGLTVNIIILLI